MKPRRTFVAIEISDAAREVCVRHIDTLRPHARDVRVGWEKPEKLHITVKFLGPTEDAVLRELDQGLREIASRAAASFQLALAEPGVFPSLRKPRILWIGVDDKKRDAGTIAERCEQLARELGFPTEERRFKPHLTIARLREPDRSRSIAERHLTTAVKPVEFQVSDIVVYESKIGPAGSIYTDLFRIKLGG